jgi:hypothetical protein
MIQLQRTFDNIVSIPIQNNRSKNKNKGCYDIILKHLISGSVHVICCQDTEPYNMIRFKFVADISDVPDARYNYYVIEHDIYDEDIFNISYIPNSCTPLGCDKINVMASGIINITCDNCCI